MHPGHINAGMLQIDTPVADSKQQPAAAEKAGKQDSYVYLSNLPVEAYEGTLRHVFEKEGLQVVSQSLLAQLQPARLLVGLEHCVLGR
jgi:hypothetical protein